MSRKKSVIKRHQILADIKYNSKVISRFINYIMKNGMKAKAENIVYKALDIVEKRTQIQGLTAFNKAIEDASPLVEVKSRRVGGATYMSPIEIKEDRRVILAMRWIKFYARERSEKTMFERLAAELIDILNGKGSTLNKRNEVHKMAESNRVFAQQKRETSATPIKTEK